MSSSFLFILCKWSSVSLSRLEKQNTSFHMTIDKPNIRPAINGNMMAINKSMKKAMNVQHVKMVVMRMMLTMWETSQGIRSLLLQKMLPKIRLTDDRKYCIVIIMRMASTSMWAMSNHSRQSSKVLVIWNKTKQY